MSSAWRWRLIPSGSRFQREAEVLAALSHPHIAQIFGHERSADLTALGLMALARSARGRCDAGARAGHHSSGLEAREHLCHSSRPGFGKHCATSQDQSVQPRYAATWRGVMQVGLLRSHGRLLRPISACDRMKLQTFFDAAHLLICCEPRWAGRDMPVGLLIVGRTSRSLSGL